MRKKLTCVPAYGFTDYGKNDFFTLANERHEMNTRSAAGGLLVPQKANLEIRKNFFSSRVVKTWNTLPFEIRMATSVNSFKNGYDMFSSSITNDDNV